MLIVHFAVCIQNAPRSAVLFYRRFSNIESGPGDVKIKEKRIKVSLIEPHVVPGRFNAKKRVANVDCYFSPPPSSLSTLIDVHLKKGRLC